LKEEVVMAAPILECLRACDGVGDGGMGARGVSVPQNTGRNIF